MIKYSGYLPKYSPSKARGGEGPPFGYGPVTSLTKQTRGRSARKLQFHPSSIVRQGRIIFCKPGLPGEGPRTALSEPPLKWISSGLQFARLLVLVQDWAVGLGPGGGRGVANFRGIRTDDRTFGFGGCALLRPFLWRGGLFLGTLLFIGTFEIDAGLEGLLEEVWASAFRALLRPRACSWT